jgi:hypothetical protein
LAVIRSIRTNHITARVSSFPNLWANISRPLAVKQTLLSLSLHKTCMQFHSGDLKTIPTYKSEQALQQCRLQRRHSHTRQKGASPA